MRNKALAAIIALLCARPLFACSVVIDWVSQGGQRVNVGAMNSSNYFMRSYPGATINVYTVGTSTPVTIYSNSACSSVKSQPFSADATSFMQFYVSVSQVDVVVSGGGLTGSRRTTYTPSPVQGSYMTQTEGDARYLQLTGGTLAGPGTLTLNGALTSNSTANFTLGLTASALTTTSNSPQALTIFGSGQQNGVIWSSDTDALNAVYIALQKGAGNPPGTMRWRLGAKGGGGTGNDFTIYDSLNNRTPLTVALSSGLITVANGLTSTAGTTTLGTTITAGLTATTGAFSGALTGTSGAYTGLLSSSGGLTISAGATSLQACTTTALNSTTGTFSGALSGTSGTFSTTLGVTGLFTGTTATLSGLLTTNGGIADKQGIGSITPLANTLSVQSNQATASPVAAVQVADPNAAVPFDYRFGVYGGLAGSDWMIYDNIAVINRFNLAKATGNVTIGSGTTAQLGIGQAPTARLVAGQGGVGVQPEEVRIDSGSGAGGDAYISFFRNGVVKGLQGVSGAANDLITGSAANDLNIRNAQAINWSANGSAAIQMSLTSGGFLGIGTTAGFPLHVSSTTSPQFISQYDATHRVGLWHDNTNGYTGTTTNEPFILRTNNINAMTVSTAQNINLAGTLGLNDSSATYPFSLKKAGAVVNGVTVVGQFVDTGATTGVLLGWTTGTGGGAIGPSQNGGVGGRAMSLYYGATVTGNLTAGLTVTSSGNIQFPAGGVTQYSGTTTTGLTVTHAKLQATGQTASIGATTLYTTSATDLHRVCWTQRITTAATTSSSLLTTISYNNGSAKTSTYWVDPSAGTTGTTADASNTVGSERGNCIVFQSPSVNAIQYATTYSTTGATTMNYSLWITVERMP